MTWNNGCPTKLTTENQKASEHSNFGANLAFSIEIGRTLQNNTI